MGADRVFAFYMPGGLCGIEPGESHTLAIKAVGAAAMAVLPRQSCRSRMKESTEIGAALFEAATRSLILAFNHSMKIGNCAAEERLAWFLTMLASSLGGPEARVVDLAMRRQDIADYLGLKIETISRTLAIFTENGLIKLPNLHRVELLQPEALAGLAAIDLEAKPIDFKLSKPGKH